MDAVDVESVLCNSSMGEAVAGEPFFECEGVRFGKRPLVKTASPLTTLAPCPCACLWSSSIDSTSLAPSVSVSEAPGVRAGTKSDDDLLGERNSASSERSSSSSASCTPSSEWKGNSPSLRTERRRAVGGRTEEEEGATTEDGALVYSRGSWTSWGAASPARGLPPGLGLVRGDELGHWQFGGSRRRREKTAEVARASAA